MSNTNVSEDIMNLIEESRNTLGTGTIQARALMHLDRIEAFVAASQPIQLVLPAFPAKSSNPRKTLGTLPDYGEVLALVGLNRLCRRIAALYAPGAKLIICSDGRVFNDLVLVDDDAVDRYKHGIREIIERYRLTFLETFDLDDVMPLVASYEDARASLVTQFGEDLAVVRKRVETDPVHTALFNGIHRFLFEDQVVLKPTLSRNRIRTLAKELAYAVIQRSNAWSRLVESRFPGAVRLSIHPQPLDSAKIGIRLLSSNDKWRTPWHSAPLFDGTGYVLVKREEAEALQAELLMADGKYPYYALTKAAV